MLKDKLNVAFRDLRKKGFIARQNYMCCQSCGRAGINNDLNDMTTEKRSKVTGYVFYHKQDNAQIKNDGSVYLAFGIDSKSDADPLDVGKIVVEVCTRAGLKVEWNEEPGTRILVS